MSTDINPFKAYSICSYTVVGTNGRGGVLLESDDSAGTSLRPVTASVPHWLAGADHGIISGGSSLNGMRVFACRIANTDELVIMGVKTPPIHTNESGVDPSDRRAGLTPLPKSMLENGELCILGPSGSMVLMDHYGVEISTPGGLGTKIGPIDGSSTRIQSSALFHGALSADAGGITRSTVVRRTNGAMPSIPSNDDTDLHISRALSGNERGLFGAPAGEFSSSGAPRNIPRSEFRHVINEFPSYVGFAGFGPESSLTMIDMPTSGTKTGGFKFRRGMSHKNALFLDSSQLIEIIGGSVVDMRSNVLDINYGPVHLGQGGGSVPMSDVARRFEEARRISRRELGYHFQLSTTTEDSSPMTTSGNFVFGIDKEGVAKLNVPRSSQTGNIPYVTSANLYNNNGDISVEPSMPTANEDVPITLRSKSGSIIYPQINHAFPAQATKRGTGVRFANSSGYFPEAGETARINTTKHHNMYAAAEMLIANTVSKIYIPPDNVTPVGRIPRGAPSSPEGFEICTGPLRGDGSEESMPHSGPMAKIVVSPKNSAINAGGGVIICGKDRTSSNNDDGTHTNGFFGNVFDIVSIEPAPNGGSTVEISQSSSGVPISSAGGRSMNVNMEGSLEMSVGADDSDNKSIVLDTAGSLVAWLGKDKNNRSAVVQTDGDVAINVGGLNGDSFSAGRFDLRVNVVNKGTLEGHYNDEPPERSMPTKGSPGDAEVLPPYASDYIISIGPHGLVIAGMNPHTPMVIRNDGDLMLEATGKLVLSGTKITMREGGKAERPSHQDAVSAPDKGLANILDVPTILKEALEVAAESLIPKSCE
jgi:hypothetical protein